MSQKCAIILLLPIMLKGMMGFLMVNGLSRMDHHWGFPYKQLPALKRSLAQIVHLFDLGATRYQAVKKLLVKSELNKNLFIQSSNKKLVNIVLGIFCLPFFLPVQLTHAQTPVTSATTQIVNQATTTPQNSAKPSATLIPSPSPSPTPYPKPESTNFQLPHPGYITTTFSSYHPGIDLCIGLGMPIKPLDKGIVTEAGYNIWGLGLMVEIDHVNCYKSIYAHMGKIYVTKGKEVSREDLLGEVGMTGKTSGPHTHLEVSFNNQKIDPRPLLPEIRNFPKEEDFVTHQSATPSAITIPTAPPATNSAVFIPEPVKEPEENNEDKLTSEKISQGILNNLLAESKSEAEKIPLTLTASLPRTQFDLEEKFTTNLSIALNRSNTKEQQQEIEKIAKQNLATIFNSPTPQPSNTPIVANQTDANTPTGGRISFDFLTMLNLK